MKIATWNVNGVRKRADELAEWIAREQPDVLCLQEIKATAEQIPAALCALDGYWAYWHGAGGYSGVALLVAKTFSPERPEYSHPAFDLETRIVVARVGALSVASVYVPNGGKDFAAKMRFLDALGAFAQTFGAAAAPLVLCGDLNVARADIDVHPKERKPLAIGQLPQEREALERMIGHGLRDVARALAPDDDRIFTWWAPWRNLRQRNIGWRIDYVLASEALAARAMSCPSHREIGTSDHAPLVATFGEGPAAAGTAP
jgi:exodeoxyribonuclease-3